MHRYGLSPCSENALSCRISRVCAGQSAGRSVMVAAGGPARARASARRSASGSRYRPAMRRTRSAAPALGIPDGVTNSGRADDPRRTGTVGRGAEPGSGHPDHRDAVPARPGPGATPRHPPQYPPFLPPSGHPVRDRHADTLPLPVVFSKLNGLTPFLAPLLPVPLLGGRKTRTATTRKASPLLLPSNPLPAYRCKPLVQCWWLSRNPQRTKSGSGSCSYSKEHPGEFGNLADWRHRQPMLR